MNREHQAAQYIIEDMAARVEKQQTIQYLTDLMATIQGAYFKNSAAIPLLIHETGEEAGIYINIFSPKGSGMTTNEGFTSRSNDDPRLERAFRLEYNPDYDEDHLWITCFDDDPDEYDDGLPEDFSEAVLKNITTWLEQAMQPTPQKATTPKDIIALWSDWCMDYDDENLWLDYMVKHPKGHCSRQHLQEKWDSCYNQYGNKAAMTMFWRQLDNTNRYILTEYVTEVWHKN